MGSGGVVTLYLSLQLREEQLVQVRLGDGPEGWS